MKFVPWGMCSEGNLKKCRDEYFKTMEKVRKAIATELSKYVVAGGFFRSAIEERPPNDVDLFLLASTDGWILTGKFPNECKSTEQRAHYFKVDGVTVSPVSQKVCSGPSGFGNASIMCEQDRVEDVLRQFDFTCCRCAGSVNGLYYDDTFFKDVDDRNIEVAKDYEFKDDKATERSWNRVLKYMTYGYTLTDESRQRYIKAASKSRISSFS